MWDIYKYSQTGLGVNKSAQVILNFQIKTLNVYNT